MLRLAATLLALACAHAMATVEQPESNARINDPEWDAFKATYKKTYKDADDELARHSLFKVSQARVAELNKLNGHPAFGINWMSDRYPHEQYKKGLVKPKDFVPTAPVREFGAPRSPKAINWRYTEAVTAIKNQGQCGSCWAFSATEATESQMVLSAGGKVKIGLSPQQITSCAPSSGTYGCQGCQGGFTEGAYEYIKSVTGLANDFFIPYGQSLTDSAQTTLPCPTAKVNAIDGEYEQLTGGYAQLEGYEYAVPPCTSGGCEDQDLASLAAALEQSPVSICVNAGVWNDYTGGVLTAAACGPMGADYQDHCVMATGFNTTAPVPYWIVRNSWASTWGDEGYIYLEMAKNTCGLADDVTIPKVKLDMTAEQAAEAARNREAMYQRATKGPE